MRKQIIGAISCLIIGVALVGVSVQSNFIISADIKTESVTQAMKVSLYIGVGLILLSGILFGLAVAVGGKSEEKHSK